MERYLEKLKTFIQIGKIIAPLSTCKRLQVGSIIFPTDCSMIYAIGYNGQPRQMPNDGCSKEAGNCGCVHAEVNAVIKFDNNFAKSSLLYTTTLPCLACARMILNCTSIVGVIWSQDYRDHSGPELLIQYNIPTIYEHDLKHDNIEILKHWKSLC